MFSMMIADLASALILLGGAWFVLPFTLRRLAEWRLSRICRLHRAIVLSYDDGPSLALTPRLLELLESAGVRATFFMIGRRADERVDVAGRIVRQGHDVGSHSYDHLNGWKHFPWSVFRDVATGIAAVDRHGGVGASFRPPFGKVSLADLLVWRRRIRYCWWTIDSRDSWAPRAIDDVIEDLRGSGGGVVLMHDADSCHRLPRDHCHADYVLTLTRHVIEFASTNAYVIMTLADLVQLRQDKQGTLVPSR
jgi:peptidoglycan/xylan/chitin deacetylase (PgdA/CDA1 family)